ncbi:MAG TPA: hypothetical protein VOA87_12255 [Thermoanaerobaculia bacterium]|nr:hypothetical protein [Thermoanaerobaculia bacterium]
MLHREDWKLGETSRAVLAAKQGEGQGPQTIANFELALGQDTERNENLFHQILRGWLSGSVRDLDLDAFNERVYAELFLTPGADPWLGLSPPGVFSGLARGGRSVVAARPSAAAAKPRAAAKPLPRLTAPSSP